MKLSFLAESNVLLSHRVPAWYPLWEAVAQAQRQSGTMPADRFASISTQGLSSLKRSGKLGDFTSGMRSLDDWDGKLANQPWWPDVKSWIRSTQAPRQVSTFSNPARQPTWGTKKYSEVAPEEQGPKIMFDYGMLNDWMLDSVIVPTQMQDPAKSPAAVASPEGGGVETQAPQWYAVHGGYVRYDPKTGKTGKEYGTPKRGETIVNKPGHDPYMSADTEASYAKQRAERALVDKARRERAARGEDPTQNW